MKKVALILALLSSGSLALAADNGPVVGEKARRALQLAKQLCPSPGNPKDGLDHLGKEIFGDSYQVRDPRIKFGAPDVASLADGKNGKLINVRVILPKGGERADGRVRLFNTEVGNIEVWMNYTNPVTCQMYVKPFHYEDI